MVTFIPGKKYDFSTLAPIALGAVRKNVTCNGVLSFILASKLSKTPLQLTAAAVAPEIGVNDKNYRNYTYYEFSNEDGTTFVIPLEWIDVNTIKNVSSDTCTFVFQNITAEQKAELKKALALLGITNYVVQ